MALANAAETASAFRAPAACESEAGSNHEPDYSVYRIALTSGVPN